MKDSRWTKTKYANLRRYVSSGVYHSFAMVRGRLIRRSLQTKSLEIAKIKLDKLLSEERAKVPANDEDWTFKQLFDEYTAGIQGNYMLKQRSKDYRLETLGMIRRNWPELESMNPRKLYLDSMKKWSHKMVEHYAPSRFNGAIETFRGVLDIAVKRGLVLENLAMQIERASVPLTPPDLPDSTQFKALLDKLDSRKERTHAAQVIRFLAYTGVRVGTLPKFYRSNVDLNKNEIILPAIKRQEFPVRVPMIPELRTLVEELLKDHHGEGPLFEISNPRRALRNACKELNIPRLTPHDMRHLFTTRCLESGVDVRTVAAWLQHRDGGSLLLKRYAHLRADHSHAMAKLVKF